MEISGQRESGAPLTPELRAQVKVEVNKMFVALFELPEADLTPEKKLFEDLGLDSLDAIDLAIRFQKEFKMKPNNQEIQELRTLGDIYQLVERYAGSSPEESV